MWFHLSMREATCSSASETARFVAERRASEQAALLVLVGQSILIGLRRGSLLPHLPSLLVSLGLGSDFGCPN